MIECLMKQRRLGPVARAAGWLYKQCTGVIGPNTLALPLRLEPKSSGQTRMLRVRVPPTHPPPTLPETEHLSGPARGCESVCSVSCDRQAAPERTEKDS